MKRRVLLSLAVTAVLLFISVPVGDLAADSGTILSIRRASTEIKGLVAEPPPAGLDPVEIDYLIESGDLLLKLSDQLDEIAVKAGEAPMRDYTPMIREAFDSFELGYLRLQEKLRAEDREFTLVAEIMNTRRDAAKNAVESIK